MKEKQENPVVLDSIPVTIEVNEVMKGLRMRNENPRLAETVQELVEAVTQVARPKVMYKVSRVTGADDTMLEIDGIAFTFPTIPDLREGERVFPYVATCGLEVEAIEVPRKEMMKSFSLNMIKTLVVRNAGSYFRDYLKRTFSLADVSRIAPGDAKGAITQQRPLFSLLGDVEGAIGVRLSEHHLMFPEKSSSGIYYETPVS